MPRPDLVDREAEQAALRSLASQDGPRLGLLYGRRRVGKTFLLDRVWPDRRVFYFLAADSTPALNRLDFIRDLASFGERPLPPEDFPTWRTVFRQLVTLAREEQLIVVIDEFQYVLGGDDDAASQLVAVWDRELENADLTMILCGSEIDVMARLGEADQPLHGRFDWSHRLRPFDYFDTRRMLADRPLRQAAEAYGMLGGTPQYLAYIQAGASLADEVSRTVLDPAGPVRNRLEHLIEQEKGIRKPAEYRAVLSAIARGRTERNEIAAGAALQDRPETVRSILGRLEDLGWIWSETNFGAPSNAPIRYRIADNAIKFWYRFIDTNRSALESGDPAEIWSLKIAPHLDTFMGKVFEGIAREAYVRRHGDWRLPPADQWARWEGLDRDRRSIEVDIVAPLADGGMLTGEVKWSRRPVGPALHTGLLRGLGALAASGQGWAREALPEADASRYLYVSAGGFTPAFVELAAGEQRITLLDLESLY